MLLVTYNTHSPTQSVVNSQPYPRIITKFKEHAGVVIQTMEVFQSLLCHFLYRRGDVR